MIVGGNKVNSNDTKYDLTKDEYNKCLLMAEIATFIKSERSENPHSIFAVAQAGAGKTGLKRFLINESLSKGEITSYTEFNPDEIAVYHKYYREILEEYPESSYKILQRFVLPALDTFLRQRAVELRNNLIQEGTFGNTEGYLQILDFQKNGGKANIGEIKEDGTRESKQIRGDYNIEINVLAVDRFESLLSCYEREQYFRDNGLPPRVVTPQNHDYAYNKLLETLHIVEAKNLFNTIRIFKRGYSIDKPELICIKGDGRYSSAVEAVITERFRNRQEILRRPEVYFDRINRLKEKVQVNGIHVQLDRLNNLEEEFKEELLRQKEK